MTMYLLIMLINTSTMRGYLLGTVEPLFLLQLGLSIWCLEGQLQTHWAASFGMQMKQVNERILE